MDPTAGPSSLTTTHGFVNTVQINSTNGTDTSDIWNRSTGISFVLFMVIGFCSTLGAIGFAVGTYLIYRRCRRLRAEQQARDEEASAVVPEPKEMYLVVHPGGSADVAHKDLDDSPRKMVLRNKPIQLSSATLDLGSGSNLTTEMTKKDEQSARVLNLTASSRLDQAQEGEAGVHQKRLDSVDATDSPKIMACHPLERPQARETQAQPVGPQALRRVPSEGLSRQSTASSSYQDDALLLTPRFMRS